MNKDKPRTPEIVRRLKWYLARDRKKDKRVKRVRVERFFLCGRRFDMQIGLIDIVPFQRVAELVNSKPHILFCVAHETPQLVIDADYVNLCLTLKNSKHVLAHPVLQNCYDDMDVAFYIEEEGHILLMKHVDGDLDITVLIPQEQFLKHEHTPCKANPKH